MASEPTNLSGLPSFLAAAPRGSLALAIILGYLVYVYFYYRPHPLPDIPYNKDIGFLGDLPEVLRNGKLGDGLYRKWVGRVAQRLNSPLIQVWLRPFQRVPLLILTDYCETNDILLRRTREFDRGPRTLDVMGSIVPHQMIALRTNDPLFKRNKELVRDLMTPKFLAEVNAPEIHAKTLHLVNLLEAKRKVGKGRPFNAFDDVHTAALDIILAAAVHWSDDRSLVKPWVEGLRSGKIQPVGAIPEDENEPVKFPDIHKPEKIEAMVKVVESLDVAFNSMFGPRHHWLLKKTAWRRSFALKEQWITEEMESAVNRISAGIGGKGHMTCALDQIVLREMDRAQAENRTPNFADPSLRDEIFGYFVAGHDTGAATMGWALKYTADNSAAQTILRRQLHAAYPAALAEGRAPSAVEIADTSGHPAPYLDAYLEECLRIARTASVHIRVATVDTTILGYNVPKGTGIMMQRIGPSYLEPSIPVANNVRSPSAKAAREKENWDQDTLHLFEPGRFLRGHEKYGGIETSQAQKKKAGEKGEFDGFVFDPHAAPNLAFSAGPRSCFGRRLAYLEMRILMVLLVWNFEFLPCAPELSSYNGADALVTKPNQCYVKLRKL